MTLQKRMTRELIIHNKKEERRQKSEFLFTNDDHKKIAEFAQKLYKKINS